ncbi:MAG: hypothetical protein JNK72_15945 [Myxococcales bacterium]|nr:hypothetical protein [Myxococcales bacterium]
MMVALTALGVVGCGTDVDALLPKGSCNTPSQSRCVDYTGEAWRTPSAGTMACSAMGSGSTYSEGACATANRIGSCTVMGGGGQESIIRFYGPTLTAQAAQAGCQQAGGVFSAN